MAARIPCTAGQVDLWFSEAPAEIAHARRLCGGCPLRRECLRGALDRGEACGVWGGELFVGGAPVPGPKRNGRPPKDAPAQDAAAHSRMHARIHAVLAGTQPAKPGTQRSISSRVGTFASSWHNTPTQPSHTRWMSK